MACGIRPWSCGRRVSAALRITAGLAPFGRQESCRCEGLQAALPVGSQWHVAVQRAIDRGDDLVSIARQSSRNR
ncbi:MAG: hypothetical protein ACI85K_000033 [Hyphomicrobiaceae bacterium]|jgi:hypothetical protein